MENKRIFRNIENDEILSLEDLKAYFTEWLANDASMEEKASYASDLDGGFAAWLNSCMAYNNGALEEIIKYSMTVFDDCKDRYYDIVAIGTSPENACIRYEWENDYPEYCLIPISWRIIPW